MSKGRRKYIKLGKLRRHLKRVKLHGRKVILQKAKRVSKLIGAFYGKNAVLWVTVTTHKF